ncbi:hypothetical protein KM043_002193 [Ampulex compressa]|nr:hypothetical protein KM043_002193 [Ampulex compressa]
MAIHRRAGDFRAALLPTERQEQRKSWAFASRVLPGHNGDQEGPIIWPKWALRVPWTVVPGARVRRTTSSRGTDVSLSVASRGRDARHYTGRKEICSGHGHSNGVLITTRIAAASAFRLSADTSRSKGLRDTLNPP